MSPIDGWRDGMSDASAVVGAFFDRLHKRDLETIKSLGMRTA